MADLYYVWEASGECQAVKRFAPATGQDNLFQVLYDWVRMKLFESCDLDPDEPRRQANAEWKRALSNLPKDTLSWHVLDKVERAMNTARELREETGALDEFDPEHLREELENIREAIPRGTKFHRVIYSDKNVAIDSYATFMAQIEWEKKNHPSPGKVPADAVKRVGDSDGGAATTNDGDGASAQADASIAHLSQAEQ